MENKNCDDMIIDEYRTRYLYKHRINIIKYLNKELEEILGKLEIKIEDKLYTEYEYDLIDEKIMDYYTDGTFEPIKLLSEKNVSKKEYEKVLEAFSEIVKDYKL